MNDEEFDVSILSVCVLNETKWETEKQAKIFAKKQMKNTLFRSSFFLFFFKL